MRQQQPPHLGGRYRGAEQIALHLGAAEDVQQIPLLLGFDTFRRRRHVAGGRDAHHGLALRIMGPLAAFGLSPDRLELEITEAVLIHDDETAILHHLRAIGVRIALDDFGIGFSSLSYLKRFPFDKIKIDRCFISDIEVDGSAAIVQAVVNIAAARNMTTTAEGVETEQQRDMLRQLGCTQMQGYLFSAPKPAAEARRLLGARLEAATAVA